MVGTLVCCAVGDQSDFAPRSRAIDLITEHRRVVGHRYNRLGTVERK